MFIRAYLRASTEEQDPNRAKEDLKTFVAKHNLKIASYYVERVSGATLKRPELTRLLADSSNDDVLLVEQIDRLTRLKSDDWENLKKAINDKGLKVVALDLPTTHIALDRTGLTKDDPITNAVIKSINSMFIDLMATMSRKDYETRRDRQRQGIEKAKKQNKYNGRVPDLEKHEQVIYYRFEKKLTVKEISKITGYSESHINRIQKKFKENNNR